MKRTALLLLWAAGMLLVFSSVVPASAAKDTGTGYQTGFNLWRAADGGFSGWTQAGVTQSSGALVIDFNGALTETDPYAAGAYYGGNFYNGGSYKVGEVTGPEMTTTFAFTEAIASWNAETPAGTWIEVQIRARKSTYWTKWYNLGIWASGTETIQRHSVRLQGDADGYVATDTLVLAKGKIPVDGYQLKARLFSTNGAATPIVRSLSVAYSAEAPKKVVMQAGDSTLWKTLLAVPECSQMVYPDGGNVWCSPTSTLMVLGYYESMNGNVPGPCEPRVKAAVAGVYDWIYDGHGNWPFNTAYAASQGMESYVARYDSLAKLEPWIKAGVPVVMSIAWNKSELTGAPVSSSSGHLVVLVGFDVNGNPIVNDPAAAADADVQRTYLRGELENVWLTNSGGTVYLIFPPGTEVPEF